MSKEIALADRYDEMQKVVDLYLANKNPTAIAKQLGIARKDVLAHIEEFHKFAKDDDVLRERVRESVHEGDQTLNMVQRKNWDIVNGPTDDKTRATVLKNIADIETKRIEMLRAAGLLSDAGLADEMAAQEERNEILKSILKDVVMHCDNCKYEVARRLAQYEGKPSPIVVVQEASPESK